jgi:hypothetical protein
MPGGESGPCFPSPFRFRAPSRNRKDIGLFSGTRTYVEMRLETTDISPGHIIGDRFVQLRTLPQFVRVSDCLINSSNMKQHCLGNVLRDSSVRLSRPKQSTYPVKLVRDRDRSK